MDYKKILLIATFFFDLHSFMVFHDFLAKLHNFDVLKDNIIEETDKKELQDLYWIEDVDIHNDRKIEFYISPLSFVASRFASHPTLLKLVLQRFREKNIFPDASTLSAVLNPLKSHDGKFSLDSVKMVTQDRLISINDLTDYYAKCGTPLYHLVRYATKQRDTHNQNILKSFEHLCLNGACYDFDDQSTDFFEILETKKPELARKFYAILSTYHAGEARRLMEEICSEKNLR